MAPCCSESERVHCRNLGERYATAIDPRVTFSWLTPPAPAAIAVVRVPAVSALLDRPLPAAGRHRFARLIDPVGTVIDELVADRMDAETLHLMPHGGPGMREAVERCLQAHGLSAAPPVVDAQWQALAAAPAPAALTWLLQHPGQTPPFAPAFLVRPPLILITGPANAGKSTLLNHWCGRQRALVSAIPGTTRDLLAAETTVAGWRLHLLDSAGLRPTADPLERAGQELVVGARARADLVLSLRPPEADVPDHPADLVVLGKADLRPPGPGLRWSASDPAIGLAHLGAAVLMRLGLPDLPTG